MTLDEYKKQQRKSLSDFKRLVKTDRDQAIAIAERRLRSAGIINDNNELVSR